jgi:DNA-binding MarR family transcriptional regulator
MKSAIQERNPQPAAGDDGGLGGIHREWSMIVHRWVRVIHAIFLRLKTPMTPIKVLLYLKLFQNDVEPSVIADFICVPRQTMTSILDGMEKDGLIVRQEHPSDRRRKLVRFARKGSALAERALKEIRRHEAQAMAALTPGELSSMLASMRKFSEALEGSVAAGAAKAEGAR